MWVNSLCFVGTNSKRRDFNKKEEKKIAVIHVENEICVSRQNAKQLPKKTRRNNISCVSTAFPDC